MSGRFVRASKYRHVFGRSTKKEQCYDNLRITNNAWDSNLIKVNPKFIAVNWEASGGGAFAVLPVNERGKLPDTIPLFRGHTAAVLDIDWNPFDDHVVASASDDAKVGIYRVPENFSLYTNSDDPKDIQPVARLSGHTRKVGHVLFNPAANNVLASSSGDYAIKIWDIESGACNLNLKHTDIVQSLSWSGDGSMLVTTCRDKKLRFWDVRQQQPVHELPGHTGAKNSRAVWMGEHDRVATTGFSRMSDRQLGLWDTRSPKEPIGGFTTLDSISGVCMPFWDDGTQMLFLAGKGDGNIRYFEYTNDKFEFLSEYKSVEAQRGIAFIPKRGVELHENEVMRAYKTVNDTYIEPVSFIVPRRAEIFQSDIYPPATGTKPAMSGGDFFGGKETSFPPKISLESLYEGQPAQEVPADQIKPRATPAPAPAAATSSPVKSQSVAASPVKQQQEPAPTPSRAPAPSSLNENKASMSAMASKFADKDEEESSDTSSFEEVPKPVDRTALRQETKVGVRTPSPTKTTSAPPPAAVESTPAPKEPEATATETPSAGASRATEGIRGVLQEMKNMLKDQADKIEALTQDVAMLKSKLGES